MYIEFQFLGPAQAFESYHRITNAQEREHLIKRAREVRVRSHAIEVALIINPCGKF
jgi:hypothetical protein